MISPSPLPYPEDALEPWMSRAALHYHHDVLYARYVQRVNELGGGHFANARSAYDAAVATGDTVLREQAAQAWLHERYFDGMRPGSTPMSPGMHAALSSSFGGGSGFVQTWIRAASEVFGSGWVHLCVHRSRRPALRIVTSKDGWLPHEHPILTMDVWEHAYYLDYPADRGGYARAWLEHLAHWTGASEALVRLR